ncbi:hypothetical protein K2P96_00480 [Patescibacteria group bacterium]|nr:hypothetical protein [Patescibacteria group bacterium]
MNIELYHVLLFIHLASLILGFGAVLVIDTFGFLWIIKKVKLSFVKQVANVTQPLIWIGWTGLVLTGIPLILLKGSISGLSAIKIFVVLMVGLNGIFLHTIKKSMDKLPDELPIPNIVKFRMTLASFISQAGWWTAIVIGFLNNKLKENAPTVSDPFFYIYLILGSIVLVFVLGEIFIKKTDN